MYFGFPGDFLFSPPCCLTQVTLKNQKQTPKQWGSCSHRGTETIKTRPIADGEGDKHSHEEHQRFLHTRKNN